MGLASTQPRSLADRCRAIEMLILDVDGVLTDGSIIYADNDVEVKAFHVRDGSGLKLWERAGKQSAIISGRASRLVEIRAQEAGIGQVFQGVADKLPVYRGILKAGNLRPEQVCFVGDDILDLPVLVNCGLAVAVGDACQDIRSDAHYVTQAPGGRGAVRETIELILGCQGRWQDVVQALRSVTL